MQISAFRYENNYKYTKYKSNTNFKSHNLKKTEKILYNNARQNSNFFKSFFISLAGLLGISKTKENEKIKKTALLDYPIELSNNCNVQFPNGEKKSVKELLSEEGVEAYQEELEYHEELFIIVKEKNNITELKNNFPGIQKIKKNVYYYPFDEKEINLNYGSTIWLNEEGEVNYVGSTPQYIIDKESYLEGKTKIKEIQKNKKVFGAVKLPAKFILLPEKTYINIKNLTKKSSKLLNEKHILVYNGKNHLELLTISDFFKLYHPTDSETSKAFFEKLYKSNKQTFPKYTETYTTPSGITFDIERKNNNNYYHWKNLSIVKDFKNQEAKPSDEELELIIKEYQKDFKKNPELKTYNIQITFGVYKSMPFSRDYLTCLLQDKNSPWGKNIEQNGEYIPRYDNKNPPTIKLNLENLIK